MQDLIWHHRCCSAKRHHVQNVHFKIIACYCSDCRETTIFEPRLCSCFLMFSVNEQFKYGLRRFH